MAFTLTVLLFMPALPVEEPPCAPGLIHYLPYCLTTSQYQALLAPPPPPPPVPIGAEPVGVERWRPMVEWFWDEPHTSRMLRIMACESGGNPYAYNGRTGVKGLFQIHPLWQKPWPGDYYDPWVNAAVAFQVWRVQGYAAWVCKG